MLEIVLIYCAIAGSIMLLFTLVDKWQENQRRARRASIRRHPVSRRKSGI